MKGVNAANLTEVVFCGLGMELIQGQQVLTSQQLEAIGSNAMHDGTTPRAERTIAAIAPIEHGRHFKLHLTAMALPSVSCHAIHADS
jgi:hypothetical protein